MLKFEFVQASEFSIPFYRISIDGDENGDIRYMAGQWELRWVSLCTPNHLRSIADKIDELNKSTKSQRILGVF